MQVNDIDVEAVKNFFDMVLGDPTFLIYQQKRLIAEANRKIKVFELYKDSKVAMLEDGGKKEEACQREIINAKNEIVLRENYIEYIKSLKDDPSVEDGDIDYIIDPLNYYIERLILSKDVVEHPSPIADLG